MALVTPELMELWGRSDSRDVGGRLAAALGTDMLSHLQRRTI
jgi:hypothetical protein